MINISIEEILFEASTSMHHQNVQNSYFFNKANSSKDVPFMNSFFFLELFQNRYFYTATFAFHSYTSYL